MGLEFQKWRASVNVAKGFRQFQKADKAVGEAELDSAVTHLEKGMQYFTTALDHAAKAEDDAFAKAGARVEKANGNLQKSLDAYASGDLDRASGLYAKALDDYDAALELVG